MFSGIEHLGLFVVTGRLLNLTPGPDVLYVGLAMVLRRGGPGALGSLPDALPAGVGGAALRRIFVQGFWTKALNPKVALFFLALLPQFIRPDASDKTVTFLLLGLIFNVNALPINLGYGLAAAWMSARFAQVQRAMGWLERGAGALFVYFGLRLALAENPNR